VVWDSRAGKPAGRHHPRLNAEINKALGTQALRDRLSGEALDPMPMTPAEFGRFIQKDIAHWSALARERGISLDD
jgi:tripartite-type tricarboxylate transporter receptor subunit TctC